MAAPGRLRRQALHPRSGRAALLRREGKIEVAPPALSAARPGELFPLAGHLQSQVLEKRYGPMHSEVRRHDAVVRESILADRRRIPRTYCLTFLTAPLPPEARAPNAEIRDGELIGETFQKHGHDVRKNVLDVFILELPAWLRSAFRAGRHALARVSEFHARKGAAAPFVYGIVTEVYSPDFRPPLLHYFDVAQQSAPVSELERAGFSRDEIWDRVGRGNDWGDVRDRHDAARVAGVPLVLAHRRRILRVLKLPHRRSEFRWTT